MSVSLLLACTLSNCLASWVSLGSGRRPRRSPPKDVGRRRSVTKPTSTPSTTTTPLTIKIGTHNARSLADPGRRLSENLAAKDSGCAIIALQETRIPAEQTILSDDGNEFMFMKMTQKRVGGLGFWIRKDMRKNAHEVVWYNERIAVLKIKIGAMKLAIVNVYSPTTSARPDTLDKFYKEVGKVYKEMPRDWTTILAGDLNASLGKTTVDDLPHLGRYGTKDVVRNENGDRLMNLACACNLSILNTLFKKQRSKYWTWRSHDAEVATTIDYFLIKSSVRHIVKDVGTFTSIHDLSDHRILRATIYAANRKVERKTRKPKPRRPAPRRIDTELYEMELASRIAELNSAGYEELTEIVKDAATKTAIVTEKSQKISPATLKLLHERRKVMDSKNSTADQRKSISEKAREAVEEDLKKWKKGRLQDAIERRASIRRTKRAVNERTELFTKLTLPCGKVTANRESIRKAVSDHFGNQFRKPTTPSQDLHFSDPNPLPILQDEVIGALKTTKSKAAPGLDDITANHLKKGGEALWRNLTRTFNESIETRKTPEDWNLIRFQLIEKKKKPEQLKDVRPIAILSIPGKLFTKVLTKRLNAVAEEYLDETQNGFRAGRSCADNLQVLTGLWEKCHEYQIPLILTFIDFKAAFDSIEWHAVQDALLTAGLAPQYAEAIRRSNEFGTGEVEILGKKIRIPVEKGVRQGDSSSPALFAIALQKLLDESDPLPEDGTNTHGITVNGVQITRLLFADDLVLIDRSPADASRRAAAIAAACRPAGLVFNTTKSKVLRNQDANGAPVTVNNEPLEDVEKIKYLGRILHKEGNLHDEISSRIRAGWAAYNNIRDEIRDLPIRDKCAFLQTTVIPATTYASETWSAKAEDLRRIQRAINCIWDAASAGPPPNMEGFVLKKKLRWAGHCARMPAGRICRRVVEWEIPDKADEYTRRKGRPRKRWEEDVTNAVKIHQHNQNLIGLGRSGRRRIGIIAEKIPWPRLARSRSPWKCLVHSYNS